MDYSAVYERFGKEQVSEELSIIREFTKIC